MTYKENDDAKPTVCEQVEKECELRPTLRLGDIVRSDLVMLNETDAETQKSQAILNYQPLLCTFLTQIVLLLIVS